MSGAFVDMALQVGVPIVRVRFVGGLPSEPVAERLDFPLAIGRQDIWLGRPIHPDELQALHYGARKQRVIDAINALGVPRELQDELMPVLMAMGTKVIHCGDVGDATVVKLVGSRDRVRSVSPPWLGQAIPFEDIACYLIRNQLSLKKLVYLDGQKAVLYRSRMNPSLARNFEAMDPLEWLARMADHIPDPGGARDPHSSS